MRFRFVLAAAIVTLTACSSSASSAVTTSVAPTTVTPTTAAVTTAVATTAAPTTTAAATTSTVLAADRPYQVIAPASYSAATPLPLVILLHGYSATGDIQNAYFQMQPLVDTRNFLYVHPDGLVDVREYQYWNATDACCSFVPPNPDDSAYLMSIIDAVKAKYAVDPKRVFVLGHSNGGFMSYRMACDHADTIAAIASLAGATFDDPSLCKPSEHVSVLQIHGTADQTIKYAGDQIMGHAYPSAEKSVTTWAKYNGCTGTLGVTGKVIDIESNLAGAETSVAAYSGCPAGVDVQLWTVADGVHIPGLSANFPTAVLDFLFSHPKP